jgi:hypothetical protein
MTTGNAAWRVSPDVRSTYSQDGAVLLSINQGLCYSLNIVASRIWMTIEASKSGTSLDAILDALQTDFPISRQELAADTAECLAKLQKMGLLYGNGFPAASKASGKASPR